METIRTMKVSLNKREDGELVYVVVKEEPKDKAESSQNYLNHMEGGLFIDLADFVKKCRVVIDKKETKG